jgi:hypothetical protein
MAQKITIRRIEVGAPDDAIQWRESLEQRDPLEDFSDAEIREVLGAIHGEPMTGYESPEADGTDRGDFTCKNCSFYDGDRMACSEKYMMQYSTRPRDREGKPIVHALGCCEQVSRMGRYFGGIRRKT